MNIHIPSNDTINDIIDGIVDRRSITVYKKTAIGRWDIKKTVLNEDGKLVETTVQLQLPLHCADEPKR